MKHRKLDFEKPIIELQRKLDELKKHPKTHSIKISFEEEVTLMEKKIEETKREIYANLSPWDRVKCARHPMRPFSLDYLGLAFTEFSELHGDRLYADDEAVVGGFAKLEGHKVIVIGTQKGRDTKDKIRPQLRQRPSQKAIAKPWADEDGRQISASPIITLIDTAGAYPGIGAEERHIAEAIAVNLREMMLLRSPSSPSSSARAAPAAHWESA